VWGYSLINEQQKLHALREVFSGLTQKELLVISLKFGINRYGICHESISEIARVLGWPPKGVRDNLTRAYARMGSARNRALLQKVFDRDLTPHNLVTHHRSIK